MVTTILVITGRGYVLGLKTQYLVRPKYFFSIGVGYSQAGAQANRSERNERKYNTVNLGLNYAEIPLIFNYRLGNKLSYTKKADYQLYRSGIIQVGVALTRID